MSENRLESLWSAGEPAYGAWLSIPNAFAAELVARQGFDYVCVDLQHGVVDRGALLGMLQAISATEAVPLARVAWNDPVQIKRVLDGGAYGVVIPWVNTPEEAAAAVAACRYPPAGSRGFGPWRAALYGGRDYAAHANEEIACIIQIETVGAIERIDDILAVPGIDGVMIGPTDLAMDMGLPPRADHPDDHHRELCARVLEACQSRGVAPGIYTSGPDEAARRAEEGWRFLPVGSDLQFVLERAIAARRLVRPGGQG
ncbi:MAG: aldolase/citrate lyase family protein [Thermoanaerobaculia bacterium]|nr:aldolase/citrate lyase family protein [Thermoanaerobaculia bacterium]